MQYKIILILLFLIYIFSSAIKDYIHSPEDIYIKEVQQEIIVNKKDIDVFDKNKLDEIAITENRIKIWNIIIYYNENNHDEIKKKLLSSGYKTKHNYKKMHYLLGPFSDISHAQEESEKLKKLHGLKNKLINLSF